jgi:hypothetical protein
MASFQPIARGLRNTLALAVNPDSGLIVQGENGIDLPQEDAPPEALNVIRQGGDYGWPYCIAPGVVEPDYARFVKSCAKYDKPYVIVPAHGAPLGMLYYSGAMFPELKGKLILDLHGYRSNGHRILAYDVTSDGHPIAPKGRQPGFPFALVDGWDLRPGTRPLGAPVAPSVGVDGAIWFAEDKNRTVMVILRGEAASLKTGGGESPPIPASAPAGWDGLFAAIKTRCSQCHNDFRAGTALKAWQNLTARGWAEPSLPADSLIVKAMKGEAPARPMPPGGLASVPGASQALANFLAASAKK